MRPGDASDGGAVGGAGHDDDVGDVVAGGERSEGVREHGLAGERREQFVAAAHPRAAAGGEQHAGGAHGVCSGRSAAKSIRPAWVWMTRLMITARVAPSASAASSTTTIVPSGR